MTNLTHNFFYMFVPNLYMFRAHMCTSSGELIVSVRHLVYVTLCRWPSGMQTCVPDGHLHRDIYQTSYWYNWFSWWRAHGCSKHVENWNKHTRKRTVHQVGYLKELHSESYSSPYKSRNAVCLTLRLLMSYIYGAPILDVSRSHTTTHHSR